MKISGRNALLAIALFLMTTAVCAGLYLVHQNSAAGTGGRNLEFRLSAFNLDHFDQPHLTPKGADVFSGSEARKIAETGEAPTGFKWLPLSDYWMDQSGGLEPRGITHVVNGREFLLVADQPELILTHTANGPAWGVKTAKFTATYRFGPVIEAVEITLDSNGRKMFQQFTKTYVHHGIAVVLDGQVIMNAMYFAPDTKGVLGFRFNDGDRAEAEKLRNDLMK